MDRSQIDDWLDAHGVPDKDSSKNRKPHDSNTPFANLKPVKSTSKGRVTHPAKKDAIAKRTGPFAKDDTDLFRSMMGDRTMAIDPRHKQGVQPPDPQGPEEARPFRKLEPEKYRHRPKVKTGSFIRNDIGLFEETITRMDDTAVHDKDDEPKVQSRRMYGLNNPELVAIEASLDLHGRTLAQAEYMLTRFLDDCVQRNHHIILIIHGKGNHTRGGDSKIRRMVRHRLANAGKLVYRSIRAPSNRGGDGATMVWLK